MPENTRECIDCSKERVPHFLYCNECLKKLAAQEEEMWKQGICPICDSKCGSECLKLE